MTTHRPKLKKTVRWPKTANGWAGDLRFGGGNQSVRYVVTTASRPSHAAELSTEGYFLFRTLKSGAFELAMTGSLNQYLLREVS